jgi:hypothetical protein
MIIDLGKVTEVTQDTPIDTGLDFAGHREVMG